MTGITTRWRPAFVLAGVAMAIGGSMHPDADAEDSLREELATMTSDDAWVLSHALVAIGTALLALGLWAAHRSRSWPGGTRRALQVTAVTMSLYVVETVFHLASVVDSSALADGDAAPVAFTHVALALVLYPVSGLTFAWLGVCLVRSAWSFEKLFGVVGVIAGLVHALSVPMTVVFPDAEITPMFAAAGMMLAGWSIGLGVAGLRREATAPAATDGLASGSRPTDRHTATARATETDGDTATYRRAEERYWRSLGVEPTERDVRLPRLGTSVRVQEVGDGAPVVFVHGGPNAGTTWAPVVSQLTGCRSILVDRPGTGLSEPYPLTADGLDRFADDFVVDVLDALELDRADVVASSFGGFLSLRGAAVAPDRFGRMVQMACPAGAPGMTVPPFMRATAVAPLRRVILALPPNERAARSMLRQIGHGKTVDAGALSPEFMEWYLALQRNTSTMRNDLGLISTLVTARGAMHPALVLDDGRLGRVDVPTHFYWGADDPFGGPEVAGRLVASMPDAALEIVADAGHLPWIDDPARAAWMIQSLLGAGRRAGRVAGVS